MTTRTIEPRTIKSIRFTGISLALAATAFAVAACSGEAQQLDTDELESEAQVDESSQSLTLDDWKATVCKVLDYVPSFPLGDAGVKDPECAVNAYDNLYYFGASTGLSTKPVCTGPVCSNYSRSISEATFCAIAETGARSQKARTARAAFRTEVGDFGSESEFRTFARDNSKRHIDSEHFGKVVIFGLPITLNYSTTSWDFKKETQSAGTAEASRDITSFTEDSPPVAVHSESPYTQNLPSATGHYLRAYTQTLTRWGIGASANFQVGPVPVTVEMDIRNKESFKDYGNGRFAPSAPKWANYAAYVDPFNLCVEECRRQGGMLCDGCGQPPSASQIAGHELLCTGGCNKGYYRDLSDGILPHSGTNGGARANIMFNDPIDNWWQFGYPGTAPLSQFGEKQYSLRQQPTATGTAYNLGIGAGYNVGIAKIAVGTELDFYARAGAALRSTSEAYDSGLPTKAHVGMQMDAEASVNLNVGVEVTLDLPILGEKKILDLRYDLIDAKDPEYGKLAAKNGAQVVWNVGTSPDTAACLEKAPPQTTTAQPPAANIWEATEEVAKRNIDNIHPCKVEICDPPFGIGKGKFKSFTWDAEKRKLVPTVTAKTGMSCEICETSVAMCNAAGAELKVSKLSKPTSCGGAGPICGGRESCDNIEDCSNTNASCDFHGCCTVVN